MKQSATVYEYSVPISVTHQKEGGFLARCAKLQGCLAEGDSISDAVSHCMDVAKHLIDLRREENMDIPLRKKAYTGISKRYSFSMPLPYQFA
jgi:predicted RNase H-like HicB family nuclease